MISIKYLLLLAPLLLLPAEGRELLRRGDDVAEVQQMEVNSSGEQRRELAWGTGTFAWMMYSVGLCNHKGPLCPAPPCHLPHHKLTQCDDEEEDEEDEEEDITSYYEYEGDEGASSGSSSGSDRSGNAGNAAQGYSALSLIGYLVGAAALVAITAAVVFKKRRGNVAINDESTIGGSVARRIELLGADGVPASLSSGSPPTFIELSSPTTSTLSATGGTNYVNM